MSQNIMDQKVIFLMGVSGSGKTTIQPRLLDDESLELIQVNTMTTRPMRPGERQGEMYDFVSDRDFEKLKGDEAFVEYALVHQQYYYATPKQAIMDAFAQGHNVLKQVDIHGWEQIIEQDDVRHYARSVFMDVSDETMRERILHRDPSTSEEDITHRIESAHYERMRAHELCDVVIDVDRMTPSEQLVVVQQAIQGLLQS